MAEREIPEIEVTPGEGFKITCDLSQPDDEDEGGFNYTLAKLNIAGFGTGTIQANEEIHFAYCSPVNLPAGSFESVVDQVENKLQAKKGTGPLELLIEFNNIPEDQISLLRAEIISQGQVYRGIPETDSGAESQEINKIGDFYSVQWMRDDETTNPDWSFFPHRHEVFEEITYFIRRIDDSSNT